MLFFILQILISEIMYNPLGSETENEFIELYNSSEYAYSLADAYIIVEEDTDRVFHVSGPKQIQPKSYGLIVSPAYFNSEERYSLAENVSLFQLEDARFSTRGLSNSVSKTVQLYFSNVGHMDSVKYELGATDGHSYEQHLPSKKWYFSRYPDGTPGKKRISAPYNVIDFINMNKDIIVRISDIEDATQLTVTLDYMHFLPSGNKEHYRVQKHEVWLTGNVEETFIFPLKVKENYTELTLSITQKSDLQYKNTHHVYNQAKYFPIYLTHINFNAGQTLSFKNPLDTKIYIDTLRLRGRGKTNAIPIHKTLDGKGLLTCSKYSKDADIWNPNIPALSTVKSKMYISAFGQEDSVQFNTEDIPFYKKGYPIKIESVQRYNYLSRWEVDRYNGKKEMPLDIDIPINPFSPNGDGYEDKLLVNINFNEFNDIQLRKDLNGNDRMLKGTKK